MSDLQRAWARSKLGLAPEPFEELDEAEEDQVPELPEGVDDDSSSASSASSVSSTGTIIPTPSQRLFARPQGVARGRTLEQIPWTTYFERELFLKSDTNPEVTYHVYLNSPVGKGPLGHGSTTAPDDGAPDLRLDTLSSDLFAMVTATKAQMGWPELPPIVLVGHSLGGAVVTDLAMSGKLGTSLLAYAVLDVVEGSAMDALQSMHTYLSTRPGGFATVESGIDWHIRTRTVRNSVSARASVPALLVWDESKDVSRPWRWRTDLAATQPFWEDWFVGLSKKFLGARGGKLLLLAGTDRLDTELTIGQMQGKTMSLWISRIPRHVETWRG
ncbi:phosphatase methylesterase 1 [Trichoderma arundinaceum]|uniref:Protein phosphatase methylesterase 1 n=1 Tax=Trichoderma arundinaceum TaxID=490622 RepID=A0A395NDJ2_TRIAR|nr:phosphatase methylesterase 1 [Trichoderma arundinaceum]